MDVVIALSAALAALGRRNRYAVFNRLERAQRAATARRRLSTTVAPRVAWVTLGVGLSALVTGTGH